jgi:hypothetical protein
MVLLEEERPSVGENDGKEGENKIEAMAGSVGWSATSID